MLLAPLNTIGYVIEADYKGDGLVPERYLAMIVDGFGKGTLQSLDHHGTSDCDIQKKLCSRYIAAGGEQCLQCFASLGGGDDGLKGNCEKQAQASAATLGASAQVSPGPKARASFRVPLI